jgi:hypothetical protein
LFQSFDISFDGIIDLIVSPEDESRLIVPPEYPSKKERFSRLVLGLSPGAVLSV